MMATQTGKRAVSSEGQGSSTVVVQELAPKRLRLTTASVSGSSPVSVGKPPTTGPGSISTGLFSGLDPSQPPTVLFQSLVKLSSTVVDTLSSNTTTSGLGNVEDLIRLLIDLWPKCNQTYNRIKISQVITELCKTPGLSYYKQIVDDLLDCLRFEKSHKVKESVLNTLNVVCHYCNVSSAAKQTVVNCAMQNLADSDHSVKRRCLSIISEHTVPTGGKSVIDTIVKTLCLYCNDVDPRVRGSALQALHHLYEKTGILNLLAYEQASSCLNDDFHYCRLMALNLLTAIGQSNADKMVTVGSSNQEISMIDDCFAKICSMVNDISVKVRCEATKLMGSFKDVSQKFLEQTLDKKLMSQLRHKKSNHERLQETVLSGEWATGRRWGADAPMEDIDPETVSLISLGACGAFVHTLEDEYLEVRTLAIDSVRRLAETHSQFAVLSLDFLVDMLNDEIESVRLNAIYSLRTISHHIVLREDQLETVLGCLDDASVDVREAVHELLAYTKLSTKDCLNQSLMVLLKNLHRYPEDKKSIWRCLKHLGANHPTLCQPLTPHLLCTHPYFDSPEPDMDDPSYIAVLMLVFNAAAKCITMLPLFPEHTIKHYLYLRDCLPDLLPHIKFGQTCSPAQNQHTMTPDGIVSLTRAIIEDTLSHVNNVDQMDSTSRQALLKLAICDLSKAEDISPENSAKTQFLRIYLDALLSLTKAIENELSVLPTALSSTNSSLTEPAVTHVIRSTSELLHLFTGISVKQQGRVRQLRIRAESVGLLYLLRSEQREKRRHKACERFIESIKTVSSFISDNELRSDPFCQSLFAQIQKLETCKSGIMSKYLHSLLAHSSPPSVVSIEDDVRICTAIINSPINHEGSDIPLKFIAGLTLAVPVDITLENITDTSAVRIQVEFPDNRVLNVTPKPSDFRQISPHRHRLVTDVILSHVAWAEACHVKLTVVILCANSSRSQSIGVNYYSCVTLQLCESVKVYIQPQPCV